MAMVSPSQVLSEKIFGKAALDDVRTSKTINDFLSAHDESSQTKKLYKNFMRNIAAFAGSKLMTTDELVAKIQVKELDVYAILKEINAFLSRRDPPVSHNTRIHMLKIIKNFFETQDGIEISPAKYKLKVKPGKRERHEKEAMERADVIEMLAAAQDMRLKTYLHFLASTGARATEALSIRNRDIDFERKKVNFRAKFTKTKQDRYSFLTDEVIGQMKTFQAWKHRPHRTTLKDKETGILKRINVKPEIKPDDLFFAAWHLTPEQNPRDTTYIYNGFVRQFNDLLSTIGKAEKEESGHRHKLTLHSFRRFVKTTISDLGYQDFSEWFLGHNSAGLGQTYYKKSEKEKRALFESKIEQALSYTDILAIEKRHAGLDSKVEGLEKENRILTIGYNQLKEMVEILMAEKKAGKQ